VSSRFNILICRGPECGDKRDSATLFDAFERAVEQATDLPPTEVGRFSCFGRCRRGPNILVREVLPNENAMLLRLMPTAGPRAVLYHGVRVDEVPLILEEHLRKGRRLDELIARNAPTVLVPPPTDKTTR
jgi:(2Fe-2S) ferredoxin